MASKKKYSFFKRIYDMIRRINSWLERCRIRVYAAQASFFIIIAALPFLILILTLIGYLIPEEGGRATEILLQAIPEDFMQIAEKILDEVSAKSNLSLLSVSAVTLLWSASRGVHGIGAGIRNVYGGEKIKSKIPTVVKSIGYTLIYIFTVIITLAIWVFGDTLISHFGMHRSLERFMTILNGSALLLVLTAVFAFTYKGYAGRKVNFFKQIGGAAFSAVGWLCYSKFFEFYIENFANYSYVYGSLAAIIIIMLWLYSCMEILLVGAGINVWVEK